MASPTNPSSLLLQEYLGTQDSRFLEVLRQASDYKALAALADRWKRDGRAWAREQILAYLELPADRPGHQTVIKRLFKHAEERRDHELMGAFMVSFDRLIRRRRKTRHYYDWPTRRVWQTESLVTPPFARPIVQNPKTLQHITRPGNPLFSNPTRLFLRRRAWRYFRRLGFQHPEQYVPAVAAALNRYRDDDVAEGENILDCWGLMHACFAKSSAIRFTADHAGLKPGASMATLSAAPAFPALWQQSSSAAVLLDMVPAARSRLVRVWAMQLLRREHAQRLSGVDPRQVLPLLDHDDEKVQQFGAELLDKATGLERLPIDVWLAMLQTRNLTALETICQLMLKHVTPDRLTLAQTVELACSRATPVAKVALGLLKSRTIATKDEKRALAALADARCGSVGRELAAWAMARMNEVYDAELAIRFFDSLTREVRQGAWEWLTSACPGYNDPILFSRLLETPYEDLRLRLVEMLEERSGLPGTGPDALAGVWCSVLLGIHRGGRHKLKALSQISAAIRRDLACAAPLIPIIAIAIRSVRSAEARPGLAALVAAVDAAPELAPLVARFLPELDLTPGEVAT